ncbi:MAG: roadblock/LC7 domain-containing protein, partial [Candidatus Competibacteraceae bacterium]|nr:roadblock/LC7 domain-containing protein [Candidatus Competibacteraceae bacterium]
APLIDKEAQTEAKRCLEQVMSQSQGLHGAIVSSIDGNDLLAVLKREMPTNRLSGMTSSLLALGETVARESGQQSCQFVIVENSAGRVVCLRVNHTLMLTCISSLDMSLGMLLSSGRQTADNLGKVIEKGGIKTA